MSLNLEALKRLPPDKRQEAEKLLAQLQQAYESNPLHRFKPHAGQAEFLAIKTRIGAAFAGNRFGKTTTGLIDGIIQFCDRDAVPEHLLPYKRWDVAEHGPLKGRIVAPKFNENIEQGILPELRKWIPRTQLKDGAFDKAFRKQQRVLEFENGSTIQFLTFDQDLDAHAGVARHWILFDEEPEGEKGLRLWEESMLRLADYRGDFRITMTPLFGLSWAYKHIWKQRLVDDQITVVSGDSTENPHVDREALEREFARMSKEMREARQQGKFVHFAGQFYPEFSDRDHVVDPPTLEHIRDQTIVVGIDPGLNHTGVVWVAFDNDNAALVFDEIKPQQAVVEDVVRRIKEVNALWRIKPSQYIIDPSARNRSTINAEAVEAAYAREGIYTTHGQNDRAAGILEVKRRLQQGELLASRNCPLLADEFENYRRDPNSSDEFAAVKENDHLLDALRYVVMERAWTLPKLPPARPRSTDPMVEPPWRGPAPTEAPPMGIYS